LRVGKERIALEQGNRVAAGFGDDRRVAVNYSYCNTLNNGA
jgi:hypothetical protein